MIGQSASSVYPSGVSSSVARPVRFSLAMRSGRRATRRRQGPIMPHRVKATVRRSSAGRERSNPGCVVP
jgi:hypothetical protein